MSYRHCDRHDQDATNGCTLCEKERVERLSAAELIEEVACLLHPGPLTDRLRELGADLRELLGPP